MSPRLRAFRQLQGRLRRSLCCAHCPLPLPLSELAVDYFDRHSSNDHMDMNFGTSLARDGCVDACTFLVAMVYLDRIRTADKVYFEMSDPSELYLSALIIACKYLHDSGQNGFIYNDEWAFSASLPLKRVNELEFAMLDSINWNANVSSTEFLRILEDVEAWVALNSLVKRGFCTYNEAAVLGSRMNLISECIKPLVLSLTAFTVIYSVAIFSLVIAAQTAISLNMRRDFTEKNSCVPLHMLNINSCKQQLKAVLPFPQANICQPNKSNTQHCSQISTSIFPNEFLNVPLNWTAFSRTIFSAQYSYNQAFFYASVSAEIPPCFNFQ